MLKGESQLRRHIMISKLLKFDNRISKLLKFDNRGGLNFIALNGNSSISKGFLKFQNLSLLTPSLSFSSQGQFNTLDKTLSGKLNFLQTQGEKKSYGLRLEGSFPFGDKLEALKLTHNVN